MSSSSTLSTSDLARIRFVAFDFDGVFTDNRVLVSDSGQESVLCNRSDGIGLQRLRDAGIQFAIFSTEVNPVVGHRAKKLRTPCYQGLEDKLAALQEVLSPLGISLEETAYLGNDINDLACLRSVGLPIAVADAEPEILPQVRWVLTRKGGLGAVRELCDQLYFSRLPANRSVQPVSGKHLAQ